MPRRAITGIDIGSSTVRVVVAEKSIDGGLNVLGIGHKTSEGIRNGYVSDIDSASQSVRDAVKAAEKIVGFSIKRAIVSVGGVGLGSVKSKESTVIAKADGEVTEYDIRRVIEQSEGKLPNLANRYIINSIPLAYKVDGTAVNGRPIGIKGSKLESEILFLTCLNQHMADLIKVIDAAGIDVDQDDIIPAPLAAGRSVLTNKLKEAGCVLADVGAGTVSIMVFENGLPFSMEVFPLGSAHITNDIALGFQVSLAEAEKLKLDFGSDVHVSKRKLSDIIEARLNDIFELVENHLKKINRNAMLPGGIILTGGGSGLFGLEEIAKSCLRLPAKIGSLRDNPSLTISAPSAIKEQILNESSWSTAIGLCIMGSEGGMIGAQPNAGQTVAKIIKHWFHSLTP